MDIKNEGWVLKEKVSKREMEVLFLLLEAAEFWVTPTTRDYEHYDHYPHIYWDPRYKFTGACGSGESPKFTYNTLEKIEYKVLVEELKKLIRKQIEENEYQERCLGARESGDN